MKIRLYNLVDMNIINTKKRFFASIRHSFFYCIFLILSLSSCSKEVINNDLGSVFNYTPANISSGVSVGDIYETYNFAAFTDLLYYKNTWYCVFRVGTEHIGGVNGQIKVLSSNDGITWKVGHIFSIDSLDLRDPKLVIDSSTNSLFIHFFGTITQNNDYRLYNFIASANSASKWEEPVKIENDVSGKQFAFWRLTNHQGKMYCVAFHIPILGGYATDNLCLFENNANNNFKFYKSLGRINLGNAPNETTIRFDQNNNMYLIPRTETANTPIGISAPPLYSNVKWIKNRLPVRLASPNFLLYKGNLIITGRDAEERTFKLFYYNTTTDTIEKAFTFPSGYETGYGGMCFNPGNKDELLITYYSITSSKSSIRLARINLPAFLR